MVFGQNLPKSWTFDMVCGLLGAGLLACSPGAHAQGLAVVTPDRVFVQAGVAEEAETVVVGAAWSWALKRDLAGGRLSGYWDASFGRWHGEAADGVASTAWVTQLGITPVLRWTPRAGASPWFAEAGIGANFLLPIYRSRDKRFSTTFNFGDHIAVGRSFGDDKRHELALRVQHFSNAGIKSPNPGENFLQLRYTWRY